jgi:hypothetical protein
MVCLCWKRHVITLPTGTCAARAYFTFQSINQILSAKERCSPSPGLTTELGFLGSVLHVELPMNVDIQQLAETASFHEKFDPTLHVTRFSLALDLR